MPDDLVDGTPVKVGKQVLQVPALNFKSLRLLKPKLDLLKGISTAASDLEEDQYNAIIHIVHTALRRNYPNMSIEELEDGLDMANLKLVINAVMANSGMQPSGEAKPGQ
jgi:hypothetical protein